MDLIAALLNKLINFIAKNSTIKQQNTIVLTYNTLVFFPTGRLSKSLDSA